MTIEIEYPRSQTRSAAPTEQGYYIAFFATGPELIRIVEINGELFNMNGVSTHFSRWNVHWSDRIEFKAKS